MQFIRRFLYKDIIINIHKHSRQQSVTKQIVVEILQLSYCTVGIIYDIPMNIIEY